MNNEEKINEEIAATENVEKKPEANVQNNTPASPTPPAASNTQTAPKLSKNQLLIAACAAFGFIVLLIVIIACAANSKDVFVSPENEIGYITNDDQEIIIFENGKMTSSKIEGNIGLSATSIDGTAFAMLTQEKALYVYTKSALTKVADEVEYFKLAVGGATLVYNTTEGEVIHYNIKKAQKEKITNTVPSAISQHERYAISPDGKTVAYIKGETIDDYALYIYTDGNSDKVGEKLIPFALSDGAELLYYYNTEKKNIYVRNKSDEDVKLISDADSITREYMYLNSDHSAIVFTANGNTYVCDNGIEKIKISSDTLEAIASMDNGWGIRLYSSCLNYSLRLYTTSLNGFKELYFLAENEDGVISLYYLDKKFESTKIEKDVEGFWTAPGSDVVYYLDDDDELFRATGPDDEKPKSIGEDISYSIAISSDATECYFVDEDDTLMYVKKDGKAKKIADDVYRIAMTHDDYLIFILDYTESTGLGTFYYSRGGGEKKKIAEEISNFGATPFATYYTFRNDDMFGVYVATKKANFDKLTDDAAYMGFGY